MGEKIKILIVGLGSIGRRHLKHLSSIDALDVAALRTNKGALNEGASVQEFYTIDEALSFMPNGVIIANPTSLHVETAMPFLKAGCKVLIEKPIDDRLEKANELKTFSQQVRVAYCLRFHPLMKALNQIFLKDSPFSITFKRSSYLPNWHPYADYRKEYAAKKELGGGVIRTLSHEIDIACSWLGTPISVKGVVDKLSFLDLDTDDFAFFSMKMSTGCRINFELDFFAPVPTNKGEAFTANGHYQWDNEQILFTAYHQKSPSALYEVPETWIDIMYQDQLIDFVEWLEGRNSINADYESGLTVLQIINNVEQQS